MFKWKYQIYIEYTERYNRRYISCQPCYSNYGVRCIAVILSDNIAVFTGRVLWRCAVRCVEYESTEEYRVVQQASDTVLLQCVNEFASIQFWTLRCVDERWVTSDGQEVNCMSTSDQHPLFLAADTETDTEAASEIVSGTECCYHGHKSWGESLRIWSGGNDNANCLQLLDFQKIPSRIHCFIQKPPKATSASVSFIGLFKTLYKYCIIIIIFNALRCISPEG